MALTDIGLCSRALLKIGANSISSFDEGTSEAEVAQNLYPHVRDSVLSAHPWTFASAQATLARLEATPVADYDHAYQLPSDFLRALSAGSGARGRGLDYRIAERRLHTNADEVVLTYIFRPDETAFPPYFDQVLMLALAAEFSVPILESTNRADAMRRLFDKEFNRAKSIDAQQDTPPRIEDFALLEARL